MRPPLTGVVGAASMIALITLASRVVGFGRWIVQSWTLHGGSATAGGYAAANQIPNVLFEVAAGGALAGVVVPLVAAPLAQHLRDDASRIASALLTWTLTVLIPIALIVALFAEPIAHLLPPPAGATGELAAAQYVFMTRLLRIFAAQIPLYGISIVLSGVLQAHRSFFWPAFAPLLSSLVVMGSYAWFGLLAAGRQADPGALPDTAVAVLGWGTTAGVAALSLPLFLPAYRLGVRFRVTWRMPGASARRALRLGTAGIGVLFAQQASVLAVLWLAPYGGDAGTLSIWQLTQAVYVLPYAIGVVPIVTAVYPSLAAAVTRGEGERWQPLVARSTRLVIAVAAAGFALLIATAAAVPSLFRVGPEMASAIVALAPALPGFALLYHFTRVLYALDRSGAAVVWGTVGWGVVALTAIVLVTVAPSLVPGVSAGREATLVAFGIAHALGLSLATVLMAASVWRVAGAPAFVGVARSIIVLGACAGVAALVGRWLVALILGAAPSLVRAFLAAGSGAALVLLIVAGAVLAVDRSAIRALRRDT
ncbi:MAG: lipid II flippase MurJ [Bowdeniella nasicola]|nr:lipid II flippase MurJ [Bowdeniella nasicola]